MFGRLNQIFKTITGVDDTPPVDPPIPSEQPQVSTLQPQKTQNQPLNKVPTLYKAKSDDTGHQSTQSLAKIAKTSTKHLNSTGLPDPSPSHNHRQMDNTTPSYGPPSSFVHIESNSRSPTPTTSTGHTWKLISHTTTSSYQKEGIIHSSIDQIDNHFIDGDATSPHYTISVHPSTHHTPETIDPQLRRDHHGGGSLDKCDPMIQSSPSDVLSPLPDTIGTGAVIQPPPLTQTHSSNSVVIPTISLNLPYNNLALNPIVLSPEQIADDNHTVSINSSDSIAATQPSLSQDTIPISVTSYCNHDSPNFLLYLLTDEHAANYYYPKDHLSTKKPLDTLFKRLQAIYLHHGGITSAIKAIKMLIIHKLGSAASAIGDYLWFYDVQQEASSEEDETEKARQLKLFESQCAKDLLISPEGKKRQKSSSSNRWLRIALIGAALLISYELSCWYLYPSTEWSIIKLFMPPETTIHVTIIPSNKPVGIIRWITGKIISIIHELLNILAFGLSTLASAISSLFSFSLSIMKYAWSTFRSLDLGMIYSYIKRVTGAIQYCRSLMMSSAFSLVSSFLSWSFSSPNPTS